MKKVGVVTLALALILAGCATGPDPTQILLSRDSLVLTYADMRVAHQSLRMLLTGPCLEGKLGPRECGELRVWDEWAANLLERVRTKLEAPIVQGDDIQRQFRELLGVVVTMGKLAIK